MSKYHNRWTEEETNLARRMIERGASDAEFMRVFGRSKKAAQGRIRSVDFPRDRSGERLKYDRKGIHVTSGSRAHVPEAVIADRDRRQFAMRTITAFVFGDPAPGQSALDKREARF